MRAAARPIRGHRQACRSRDPRPSGGGQGPRRSTCPRPGVGSPDGAYVQPASYHRSGEVSGAGPGHSPAAVNGSGGAGAAPAPFSSPGRGDRFTIGRTRDCDLCLTDLSVSRLHAELVRGRDGWLLNDLGSHNGTRLNGWLVRETVSVRRRPAGVRFRGVRGPGGPGQACGYRQLRLTVRFRVTD